MFKTFLSACLAGVALSLTLESKLQLPDTSPDMHFAQASIESLPVELDWGDEEDARDFSVAVDDMGHPVSVEHAGGRQSDTLPAISNAAAGGDIELSQLQQLHWAPKECERIEQCLSNQRTLSLYTIFAARQGPYEDTEQYAINKKVNDYEPPKNIFGICGAGHKLEFDEANEKAVLMMKNTCPSVIE